VKELRSEPRCRRRAYLACVVTYHITDYLNKAGHSQDTVHSAMHIVSRDGPYDIVRAICNAAKHCGLDSKHSVPFVVGSDYERPPAIAGIAVADLSVCDDQTGGREIFHSGRIVDIYWSVVTLLREFQHNFIELAATNLADL
jgi:hypothetical protein